MSETANAITNNDTRITALDGLALQARTLRMTIDMNLWQLAKVFVDARELVPHGEWGKWLRENADVSEKTAQDMMAAYRRFGGRPQFEQIGRAKAFRLLPLPEGTEESFMREHDVEKMSTREIQEAVKRARAEAKAKLDAAQKRIRELEGREPQIPQEVTDELRKRSEENARLKGEIERIADSARDNLAETMKLRSENAQLTRDVKEQEELLREQQDALNKAQEDLLNYQSAQARGDAEHEHTDELTAEVFGAAVREFMGQCARLPYMGGAFATMGQKERNRYSTALRTIEGFCTQARKALECTAVEGGIVG